MVTLIPIALEIHGCDLTNRVIITFTYMGNSLGSPCVYPPEELPERAEA
jgi:hypothetical protein